MQNTSRKVLISGANGFVGTNLCAYLEERGVEVAKLDVSNADFTWEELGKIDFAGFDAVIHLAGKAHDLKKVACEKEYFDINLGLTQQLYGAMEAKSPGARFIYFSSIKALDSDTPYARSKRAAEEFLSAKPNVVVLEPAMIHGPGNKGNLNLLVKVVRRRIPWPLAAFENRRSFTSIGNICAIVFAFLSPAAPAGKYPVADDEAVSTNRIIALIAESFGFKPRLWKISPALIRLAARVGDIFHLPLDTERLGKLAGNSVVDNRSVKAALGWDRLPIAAEDGLKTTLIAFGGCQ